VEEKLRRKTQEEREKEKNIRETEAGQRRNADYKAMVLNSSVHITAVESNMAKQKLFSMFNAKDEGRRFSNSLIRLSFHQPTVFNIPQDSIIHETVHPSLHSFINPPSGL
jgi:hypothetical protein